MTRDNALLAEWNIRLETATNLFAAACQKHVAILMSGDERAAEDCRAEVHDCLDALLDARTALMKVQLKAFRENNR